MVHGEMLSYPPFWIVLGSGDVSRAYVLPLYPRVDVWICRSIFDVLRLGSGGAWAVERWFSFF